MKMMLLCSIGFATIAGILALMYSHAPDGYPIGSMLPDLSYREGSKCAWRIDSTHALLLIIFSADCDHCRHELDAINKRIEMFDGYRLYFLSIDDPERIAGLKRKWSKLFADKRNNVHLGFINKDDVIAALDLPMIPAILIFDKLGKLENKLFGEVRPEMLTTPTHQEGMRSRPTGAAN